MSVVKGIKHIKPLPPTAVCLRTRIFVNSIYTVYEVLMKWSQITIFQNLNLGLVNESNFKTLLIINLKTHRNVNTTCRKIVNP